MAIVILIQEIQGNKELSQWTWFMHESFQTFVPVWTKVNTGNRFSGITMLYIQGNLPSTLSEGYLDLKFVIFLCFWVTELIVFVDVEHSSRTALEICGSNSRGEKLLVWPVVQNNIITTLSLQYSIINRRIAVGNTSICFTRETWKHKSSSNWAIWSADVNAWNL